MRFCRYVVLVIVVASAALAVSALAQSDDTPLGDVARSYRKNQAPPDTVIDNDNLPQVMDQGESKKWALSAARLASPRPATQLINFQSANVTCALSFTANSPDLLANAPRPQRLPDSEVLKLDGPASIVANTLELSVLNATAWDVREITVGVTIVRRPAAPTAFLGPAVKLLPTAAESRSNGRKQADLTTVYHLHGEAAPFSTAIFREPLERPLESDEEWHWAILQAKGLPPAPPAADVAQEGSAPAQTVAQSATAASATGSGGPTRPASAESTRTEQLENTSPTPPKQ